MTDSDLQKALEEYAAAQPPAAAPGAINWTLLLPLIRMILPLVVPADLMQKIREWINQIFPTA